MMPGWLKALQTAASLIGESGALGRILDAALAKDPELLSPPPESPDETIDAEAREKLAKKFPEG